MNVNNFTNTYSIEPEQYFNYLEKLITNKYKDISKSLFTEYLILLFKKKKYSECIAFYNQYKNAILYIIHSNCMPIIKLNTAFFIIRSNIFNDSFISCKEITDIIGCINFEEVYNTNNYSKILDYIL